MTTTVQQIAVAASDYVARQLEAQKNGTVLMLKATDVLKGGVKVGTVLRFMKSVGEEKPVAKAEPKNAKAESAAVNSVESMTASALRDCVVMIGRKKVDVARVTRNKETGVRSVVLATGEIFPLSKLEAGSKEGVLRVVEAVEPAQQPKAKVEEKPAAHAELKSSDIRGKVLRVEAGKKGLPVVKITFKEEGGEKHRFAVLSDGQKIPVSEIVLERGMLTWVKPAAKNAKAETKPAPKANVSDNTKKARTRRVIEDVTAADVRGATFELVKGSKTKKVTIAKISKIENVRCAVTEGGVGLELDLIKKIDGVLTYTGTLTAELFREA